MQNRCVRVAVLSDTHAPRFWKGCPPRVADRLRGADLILHAGDVCTVAVLDELSTFAEVRAVRGNNDGPEIIGWGAPTTLELEIEGLKVVMLHDAGPATGRAGRMHKWFPQADLVIYGHSHIPLDLTEDGVRIFNPGSPTDKRRQPHGTMGLLDIQNGELTRAQIVAV